MGEEMFGLFKKKVNLETIEIISTEVALIMGWFGDNHGPCKNTEIAFKKVIRRILEGDNFSFDENIVEMVYLYSVDNLIEDKSLKMSWQSESFQHHIDNYLETLKISKPAKGHREIDMLCFIDDDK